MPVTPAAERVRLRTVQDDDLPVIWEQLTDPDLQHMAAATRKYHYDRDAFEQYWAKVRRDPTVFARTVLAGAEVAGHAAIFGDPLEREVSYTLGRTYWGAGSALRSSVS